MIAPLTVPAMPDCTVVSKPPLSLSAVLAADSQGRTGHTHLWAAPLGTCSPWPVNTVGGHQVSTADGVLIETLI